MEKIFLAIILVSCMSLKSIKINKEEEVSITSDLQTLLMSKDWEPLGRGKELITVRYTETEEIFYRNERISSRRKYYISTTSCDEKEYDPTQVGIRNSGNYFMGDDGDCESVVIESANKITFHHLYSAGAPTFTLVAKGGSVNAGGSDNTVSSNFTSGRDGWLDNFGTTSVIENGKLKVNVARRWSGLRRELSEFSIAPGDTFTVSVTFDKSNTAAAVRLYFQELDASGNHLSWNTINGDLKSGTSTYSYTVKNGNKLVLRIDKTNTHENETTSFYIDHISVSKQ